MLTDAERTLTDAHQAVAAGHANVADVAFTCARFAREGEDRRAAAEAVAARYPVNGSSADRLGPPPFTGVRLGASGLVRDLVELHQLAAFVEIAWELVGQAACGMRDRELIDLGAGAMEALRAQVAWTRTKIRAESAQALLVAP